LLRALAAHDFLGDTNFLRYLLLYKTKQKTERPDDDDKRHHAKAATALHRHDRVWFQRGHHGHHSQSRER
jgi:hypothetical protein